MTPSEDKRANNRSEADAYAWVDGPSTPVATPDAVHIWRVSLCCSPDQLERSQTLLSQDEQERALRLRTLMLQNRFIAGRAALKRILGQYMHEHPKDVVLTYHAFGKPELEARDSSDITFNVSHVDDLMLVALTSQRRIGVDVDRMRPNLAVDEIASRFFTHSEIAVLSAASPDHRDETFLQCWSRKEAFAKALGVGMAAAIDPTEGREERPRTEAESGQWRAGADVRWEIANVNVGLGGDYVASLCVEGAGWTIERWLWRD